jgi:hypothetical protein
MALDLLKKTRWISIASMLALASGAAMGCGVDAASDSASTDDGTGSSTDDITQVDQTKVKRQSIGNCWLYATTSWLEALNKAATGEEKNTSESWLTYWHWYEQIANGRAGTEVSTGGSWGTAVDIILRYGVVMEKDFIAAEAESEMSNRQSTALDAMNRALKDGALKDPASRRDRKLVRKVLDDAWQLDDATRQRIDAVFGAGVEKTLDRAYVNTAPGNGVIRAKDFPAQLKDPTTGQMVKVTLADAIGKSNGWWGPREGKLAWNEATYPSDAAGRRAFLKRVQKALHDQMPVIMSWRVDFNALTQDSHFSLEELQRRGPGRQGGHMTVMHDYEATNVPQFGTLKAGQQATKEQMDAALSDQTQIVFIRVKNSWGGIRPDRWSEAAIPGYHDLDLKYLNGPIKQCPETHGTPDPATCTTNTVPFWDVVLPAGY